MKSFELESILHGVKGFESPKIQLEQYETTAHLGSKMLLTIDEMDGFEDSTVLDLGVGPGRLSIGSIFMGASYVLGVDIDSDALRICQQNCQQIQDDEEDENLIKELDLLQADVTEGCDLERYKNFFDIIIMNPPFGTKTKPGIDMLFLRKAIELCPRVIYSLHKTSTRDHILKKAHEFGIPEPEVVATLIWNLPKTYDFHKKKSKDIHVDLFRFENKDF